MADLKDIKALAREHGWSSDKLRDAIDQVGGRVDALLGCGSIGCTFEIGHDEQTVLKVTADAGEFDLWLQMFEMQEGRHRTTRGVPRVFDAGAIDGLGGTTPAYYVVRESVEPLVMGSEMNVGTRTRRFLFRELAPALPQKLPMQDDWSFTHLANRLYYRKFRVTRAMIRRCESFDEDLKKLYDLTDVTGLAEGEPSVRDQIWRKTYSNVARSVRAPLDGIGVMVASILAETGTTWVTDLHMGNLGWRIGPKPQVLAYDWLTAELVPNGKLV